MKPTYAAIDDQSKIWTHLYRVRLPYLKSRTISDIKEKGVVLSGVPEIDRDIRNQWMVTMLSIAQMLEYYKEDVPLRVTSGSDVKEIYQHISDYIYAWKQRLERGINIGDAPIDDLIMLDRFANTVYEHAKYQFTPDIIESIFAKQLGQVQKLNATNFFNNQNMRDTGFSTDENGVTRIKPDQEIPDRDSLSDFFKSRLITFRRY
jgi:hypothetical protein